MKQDKFNQNYSGKPAEITRQIKVRSAICSGNDCSLGIQYWRKEYNDIKKQAQLWGCSI